jgi:hypothetical protein
MPANERELNAMLRRYWSGVSRRRLKGWRRKVGHVRNDSPSPVLRQRAFRAAAPSRKQRETAGDMAVAHPAGDLYRLALN